jgi:hypothetical protein
MMAFFSRPRAPAFQSIVPQPAAGKSERARAEHPCLVLVAACWARAAHALDHAKSDNSLL